MASLHLIAWAKIYSLYHGMWLQYLYLRNCSNHSHTSNLADYIVSSELSAIDSTGNLFWNWFMESWHLITRVTICSIVYVICNFCTCTNLAALHHFFGALIHHINRFNGEIWQSYIFIRFHETALKHYWTMHLNLSLKDGVYISSNVTDSIGICCY